MCMRVRARADNFRAKANATVTVVLSVCFFFLPVIVKLTIAVPVALGFTLSCGISFGIREVRTIYGVIG